jgi:O-antigen ligase
LHTDFANIIHSAGVFGLFLYLMMVLVAFLHVWKRTKTKADRLQFYFILFCFLIYFINGRYITANAMLMMFGVLNLPVSKKSLKIELIPEKKFV